MRNYTNRNFFFPKKGIFILLLTVAAALTGCKKDEEDNTPKYSNLMFIHAIPDAATMDLYIDEKVAANGVAFGSATPYVQVAAGKHLVTTTETGTIQKKVNASHVFDADKKFSVIGFGSSAKTESLLVTDTTATPAAGKFWVHYINLSPAAGNAAYVIYGPNNNGIPEFGTRNYKTVSNYREYDAGMKTFNAVNINAGNPAVNATTGEVSFESGKIYTLILLGTEGGTAPANLQLKAVVNQ